MDVNSSNAAIKDGSLSKIIQDTLEKLKPEACYFYPENGKRTALFVFDLQHQSDIPWIAEPFFMGTGASVEFFPVMNADDLKAGLDKATAARQEFTRV
jgi:hypothetical protein